MMYMYIIILGVPYSSRFHTFTKSYRCISLCYFSQEIEGQLDLEQQRVVQLQLEITKLRQEMDRKMNEKDEEAESLRKNHQRQMASLQQSIEEETRLKNEQVKQKKMMEGQVDELNTSLEDQAKVSLFVIINTLCNTYFFGQYCSFPTSIIIFY